MTTTARSESAHHEAGHALLGVRLNFPVSGVVIGARQYGLVLIGAEPVPDLPAAMATAHARPLCPPVIPPGTPAHRILDWSLMLQAGPIAAALASQRAFSPGDEGAFTDLYTSEYLLGGLLGVKPWSAEVQVVLMRLQAEARRRLIWQWSIVQRIATALLEAGELTGERVRELIR